MVNNRETNINNNLIVKSVAVKATDLVYSYSNNNVVLNKCSINVPKGEIYALLGSSGCGKTTLINCIIGRLRPHSGEIVVFGKHYKLIKRNLIGYMPQQLSLFNDFTIEENIKYFAKLNGMSDKHISEKIKELAKLLNLPEKSRLISKLSGGQKRRVSLIIALIHSPPLVILDEPTIGVDPVLRHEIWHYLKSVCATNSLTVIITTHYTEEARNASTIGYIRDGQILVEECPQTLFNKYQCNKLEDVLLILCKNNIPINNNNHISDDNTENLNYSKYCGIEWCYQWYTEKQRSVCFEHFVTLIKKNTVKIYRSDRYISIVLAMLPLSVLFFFTTVVKHDIKFPISTVLSDQYDNLSAEYLNLLNNNKRFINHIHHSESSVINSVIDGKSKVGILLSRNLTNDLNDIYVNNRYDHHSYDSSIKVYFELIETNDMLIMPELQTIYLSLVEKYLSSIGQNPIAAQPPFEQIYVYGDTTRSRLYFNIPGFIIDPIFITTLIMCLHSIIAEKTEGVFERSIICGVNCFNYYFAQFIVRLVLLIPQTMLYMICIYPILIESRLENLSLLYITLYLIGITGITLAFLISSIVNRQVLAFNIVFSLLLIIMFMEGSIWPLDAMPQSVQYLSKYLLPVTITRQSVHSILYRGFSYTHYEVWIGLASSVVFSIIYFSAALIYSHINAFK